MFETDLSAQSNPHRTGFLDLPVELRLQVYEDALIPTGNVCFCQSSTNDHNKQRATDLDPFHGDHCHPSMPIALLQTCRTIRNEAIDIFFERNTFMIRMLRKPDRFSDDDTDPETKEQCLDSRCIQGAFEGKHCGIIDGGSDENGRKADKQAVSQRHSGKGYQIALDVPDHLLSRLYKVFLINTVDDYASSDDISNLFKSMTSLKTLRISAVEQWPPTLKHSLPKMMLRAHSYKQAITSITENVPSGSRISFGAISTVEQSYISQMQAESSKSLFEVASADLLMYAKDALRRRGELAQEDPA